MVLINYKNCFYIIKYNVLAMAENMANKSNDSKRDAQNNDEIKSIILGLFALIGFIILIYSIFMGVVGEQLASVADTVFVAAIIGSFTLVSTLVNVIFLKKWKISIDNFYSEKLFSIIICSHFVYNITANSDKKYIITSSIDE